MKDLLINEYIEDKKRDRGREGEGGEKEIGVHKMLILKPDILLSFITYVY